MESGVWFDYITLCHLSDDHLDMGRPGGRELIFIIGGASEGGGRIEIAKNLDLGLTGKGLDCAHSLVLNNGAPIGRASLQKQ